MTRFVRFCLFLLLALATSSLASSGSSPAIYPLSQVRQGQIAVVKTVFRGTKIDSFHMEIVGVVPKTSGSRSMILGKVIDGPVIARNLGVAAGMSGSPVYIDGRLAGALAYAWPWNKEPIAGIQPIEDMLAVLKGKGEPASAVAAGGAPLRLDGSLIHDVRVSPQPTGEPDPPGVVTLVPLGGLVQVSGFNQRGIDRLTQTLAPYGLRVVAGVGGAEMDLTPPLVPGAGVAAKLITGDFDAAAMGTVTMVEGDRLLAFGHPLFQRGRIDVPMSGGYVYDIMSSLYISNKVMSPTRTVGRVYADEQTAIAGSIGPKADMVPVSIEVEDAELAVTRDFSVQVARLREMTPGLVASAVVTAIDEARNRVSRGTAHVSVDIEAGDRKISREDIAYSATDAAVAALPPVLLPLAQFEENQFGTLHIDKVSVKVHTEEERKTASIERVTVEQSRVKAGDEVLLKVMVRPYGHDPVEVPVTLSIPADMPQGQVRIVVSSGSEADQARTMLGAPRPSPVNMDQLIDRYMTQEQSLDLVIQAALPRGGVSMLGEELPNLPGAALEALRATRATDLRPMPTVAKVVHSTEWVLSGRQALMIPVESPISGGMMPKPPPGRGPEGPEGPQGPEEEAAWQVLPAPLAQPAGRFGEVAMGAGPPGGKPSQEKPEKQPEPLMRAPSEWTESAASDYSEAKLENVVLSPEGMLQLGPAHRKLGAVPAEIVWSIAVKDGITYLGTGSEGKIYRTSGGGDFMEYFDTGQLGVQSLAFDSEGDLWAGTSPRGNLFRISGEETGELALEVDGNYVWSLAIAKDGTIYAGTGWPGKVYALDPDGIARVLASLPAANVLSLAIGPDEKLYAGTSDAGVVYRIDQDGTATAVARVSGSSVDALAFDSEGTLFASSSPGGEVFRLPRGGIASPCLDTGQRTIFGLAVLEGRLVAGTGPAGLVLRANTGLEPEVLYRPESGIATAMTVVDGALYVATSGPALLDAFGPSQAAVGTVESEALDAQRPAHWGRMSWMADTPEGTEVTAETRSGDSPMPGRSWNGWTPTLGEGTIASPPARYLQYRLSLTTDSTAKTPVIRQVSISREDENQPPQVVLRSPEPGAYLSKKQTLKWQARDLDKDKLTYDVELSDDYGETWTEVVKDHRETSYEWDTSKQDNGEYLLRLTASDRLGAPRDPKTADVVEVIWVDNEAPDLILFKTSLKVDEERRASISGMATDAISPIQAVEYRVGDGEWQTVALSTVSGQVTAVDVRTEPLTKGSHKLEVRAFDAADNYATESVEVEVEAGEEQAEEAKPHEAPSEEAGAEAPAEAEESVEQAPGEASEEAGEAPEAESGDRNEETAPDEADSEPEG